MKVSFSEIFDVVDGMINPKVPVTYRGTGLNPGQSFSIGETVLGVNFSNYIDKYFEVNKEDGIYHIQSFYE